jgi:hypothetical protein
MEILLGCCSVVETAVYSGPDRRNMIFAMRREAV